MLENLDEYTAKNAVKYGSFAVVGGVIGYLNGSNPKTGDKVVVSGAVTTGQNGIQYLQNNIPYIQGPEDLVYDDPAVFAGFLTGIAVGEKLSSDVPSPDEVYDDVK